MKKYKIVKEQEYLDELYKLIKNFELTDEEKKEVDIIITEYSQYLQKINKIVSDKSKVKKISEVVQTILEE
tara:strand:- start:235 stop:447 length:213 start_codon:yes stop_codon:yes gene_type:complete